MARKQKPEEIIGKLREAEIVLAQGRTVADACHRIGVTFGKLLQRLLDMLCVIRGQCARFRISRFRVSDKRAVKRLRGNEDLLAARLDFLAIDRQVRNHPEQISPRLGPIGKNQIDARPAQIHIMYYIGREIGRAQAAAHRTLQFTTRFEKDGLHVRPAQTGR